MYICYTYSLEIVLVLSIQVILRKAMLSTELDLFTEKF